MLFSILLSFALPVENTESESVRCGKWCKGALAVGATIGIGALAYKHMPVKSTANKEILMKSLSQNSVHHLGHSVSVTSNQVPNELARTLSSNSVNNVVPVIQQVAPRRSYADVVRRITKK